MDILTISEKASANAPVKNAELAQGGEHQNNEYNKKTGELSALKVVTGRKT